MNARIEPALSISQAVPQLPLPLFWYTPGIFLLLLQFRFQSPHSGTAKPPVRQPPSSRMSSHPKCISCRSQFDNSSSRLPGGPRLKFVRAGAQPLDLLGEIGHQFGELRPLGRRYPRQFESFLLNSEILEHECDGLRPPFGLEISFLVVAIAGVASTHDHAI